MSELTIVMHHEVSPIVNSKCAGVKGLELEGLYVSKTILKGAFVSLYKNGGVR